MRRRAAEAAAKTAVWARERWPRLLAGSLLLVGLFGNGGSRSLVRHWRELRRLRGEIASLEREQAELERRLKSLRSGDAAVERVARGELGYIGKGEIEYRFPPPGKPERRP